jgi:phosphoribosylamine--glycine ligase
MKILVIGGGGREHALVWKLRQSPRVTRLYCAPGNAGIGASAELVRIEANDLQGLVRFAVQEEIDLVVPGPELPLTLGIVDELERRSVKAFGPSKAAARIEGSKSFTKELLRRCQVPTGFFSSFADPDEAIGYVNEVGLPIVVKADGLASGKGVIICRTAAEAEKAIHEIMRWKIFGDAGDRIVVEEFLEGEEASFMAVTDGATVLPLASSQDHKRAFDGDAGPNTGGMGAYSPAAVVTPAMHERIMNEILHPVVRGLAQRKIVYRGVLYAGLMITADGPKVLEFNARFGDPECQVLMPRLESDLLELMLATVDGRLHETQVRWDARAAACVVLAAAGYPGSYERGKVIEGLDERGECSGAVVFHAGTARRDSEWVTNGGRVLGVTALGEGVREAVKQAYRAVEGIRWEGVHFRRDIGHRALGGEAPS